MYFPYLRGKQFEFIALRELLELNLISNKVIPVIEPIKPSSSFFKLINFYAEKERSIALISNPSVGSFEVEVKTKNLEENFYELYVKDKVILAHIINRFSKQQLQDLREKDMKTNEILLINTINGMDFYEECFVEEVPLYNFIPDNMTFRRKNYKNKVVFEDRFIKQPRNTDYSKNTDEFFADIHLHYKSENLFGFSDYSIIGSDYSESGFSPYAVAIHIVYFGKKGELRVIHFVSDTNKDSSDPAGKFGEAVGKLLEWQNENKLNTHAIREFVKHAENGTYPGLGVVKKLSIMHHIELISKFLDGDII